MEFSLRLNGTTDIASTMPSVTGELFGSALITVGATPATFALVNTTGATVLYAAVPVQANIVISHIV
ncbi:hypothetical protein [Caproiciproducens sp. NJN-50]|uniref:hypothetical protein n=1 Tax=Caproiciproducens sp. NJN-50 TaxID=2507162 RepID=UPI001FAAECA5|nr:hypothetical protein [Caproiciproducens sp. NJN-50]